MGVFYVNDSMIRSRDPEWLQGDTNVLIGLFIRFGLMANVANSNTMTCQLGCIFAGMKEEAFSPRIKGGGGTYRERIWWCIPYPYCGVELNCRSMTAHRRLFHGMKLVIYW